MKSFLISLLAFVIGTCGGFVTNYMVISPKPENEIYVANGELNIQFLELGNSNTGDCIYISVGNTDIIVDGGSRTNSSETIYNTINPQVEDSKIEYVIVTHADQDHIASFAGDKSNKSLFEYFDCETIIDFPLTNKTTTVYKNYVSSRDAEIGEGAKHYNALQCYKEQDGASKIYDLGSGIEMEFLYNYFYENESDDENNYSVCFQINQGDKHFLFTGDLEKEGEELLVQNNNLSQVELFKAGHHGSKTSSNDILLEKIKPKICVVTCVSGSVEYSGKDETNDLTYASAEFKTFMENTFPTQKFIDRIAKYTSQVYVTSMISLVYDSESHKYKDNACNSMNGIVTVISTKKEVKVECSNNNTLLKDTQWFKDNRITPASGWASLN